MSKNKATGEVPTQADAMRRKLKADGFLLLEVKVIPCARGAKWQGEPGTMQTSGGILGVPKRNVHITAGQTSRQKRLKILL